MAAGQHSSDHRSLKQRLAAGEQLVGGLVRMPSEEIVEMMAVSGFDFVLLDCEHGPAEVTALRHHIALAQVHGVPTLVRPGEGEEGLVLRALDQGAEGIVAPHIDRRAQAEALVRAVHYPPRGHRGFATYPRAGRFGSVTPAEHRDRCLADTLLLAMIETPTAVGHAAEILSCPGVDGYLIGTGDLAATSGPADPSVPEAIAHVDEAARAVGAWRAELATSTEGARTSLQQGARLVVHNIAHELMGLFGELTARPGSPG